MIAMNLRTDLGLDSVDVVSIVSQVERRFRIRLTQQDSGKAGDRRRRARFAASEASGKRGEAA